MASFDGDVVTRVGVGYEQARKNWNAVYRSHPEEILYPADVLEAQKAVAYVQERGLPFRIRSGGHGFDGFSSLNGHSHPDLFWALRGAGGNNFGVVVSLTFQAYRIPEVLVGTVQWDWNHLADVGEAFQRWLPTLDSRINVTAVLPPRDRGHVALALVSLASRENTEPSLSSLLAASPPIQRRAFSTTRYVDAVSIPSTSDLSTPTGSVRLA
jgi:hypothetical protein